MTPRPTVLVQGSVKPEEIPHLDSVRRRADVRSVGADEPLGDALNGVQILLGWDFQADALRSAWAAAGALRWIHWCGAGVDAVLFPELARSTVRLTNARGIFDRAMAEYVLGLVLALAKRMPETVRLQAEHRWQHRLTERIDGCTALVVGAGSIGRSIARLLRAVGMRVEGVGRRARGGDAEFERVHGSAELGAVIGRADYVIVVTPLTAETVGLVGRDAIGAMRRGARLVNVARGPVVDEDALVEGLVQGHLGGAALDVFDTEPLPGDHRLWDTANLIVSPHMSGDFRGFDADLGWLFAENFRRFHSGQPLLNEVDKLRGY